MFFLVDTAGGLEEGGDPIPDIGEAELAAFLRGSGVESPQLDEQELAWLEQAGSGDGQEQAATKIQAAFRGYRVRKDQQQGGQ